MKMKIVNKKREGKNYFPHFSNKSGGNKYKKIFGIIRKDTNSEIERM